MLFVIKHLSAHNLPQTGEAKKKYKHNLQKWWWTRILQPFASRAVILNRAALSGSSTILCGNVGQLSTWAPGQGVHYLYEFMTKFFLDSNSKIGVCKHSSSVFTRELLKQIEIKLRCLRSTQAIGHALLVASELWQSTSFAKTTKLPKHEKLLFVISKHKFTKRKKYKNSIKFESFPHFLTFYMTFV